MSLLLPPKPSLQTFIETCTPLAIIESLEAEFRVRVESIANALLNYSPNDEPLENLTQFLQAHESFLGVILALTNLSQEKFLRILSAERFARNDFEREWTVDPVQHKLKYEPGFASQIARLFLDGRNSPLLVQQVAAFYLDQLALPENWPSVIRDPNLIQNVIRRKLAGAYTDRKGDAIEAIIRAELDSIRDQYGVTHAKGQVQLVGKEVDHAIPSTADPFLGTGTTAIAAKNLQRHYIGIELDPMYEKIANDKLAKITKPTLYEGYPVSLYLKKVQSIRDVDAAKLFPKQLTSTEKKRKKAASAPSTNGHKPEQLPIPEPFPF